MTITCHGSATGLKWTSYFPQHGLEEREGDSNTLCGQTELKIPASTQSSNNRKYRQQASINIRFLTAFVVLLLSIGVQAEAASYQFESGKELLFDRRVPPTIQVQTYDSRRAAFSPRKLDWRSFLLPRSGPHAALPSPFDSSIGNNFTSSSCPAFFETFLNNASFHDCLPFSLLLQTSNGFFDATRSRSKLTGILKATCNVNYQQCSHLMASYAEQIQSQDNCGADLKLQNPLVQQAYNGFVAYEPMYRSGCLKDDNGDFCFVDAATNRSSSASSYVYYLPLGIQLPITVTPQCNKCLRDTMTILTTFAGDANQPLSKDYNAAAQYVQSYCDFRHVKFPAKHTSGVSPLGPSQNTMVFWAAFLILLQFFL